MVKKENNKKDITWKNNDTPKNIYSEVNQLIDPIKLIYKYKNNNKKNQYLLYIFVGSIGKRYEDIFKKIENLNLYDTLLKINEEEFTRLNTGFGESWINKFFNIYHISGFINNLDKNPELKRKLFKKYLEDWLINFINKFKSKIIFKKVNYSYSELIKFQFKVKMGKKLEKILFKKEDIEDISFKTPEKNNKSENILYELSKGINQEGGDIFDNSDNNQDNEIDDSDLSLNSELIEDNDDYELITEEEDKDELDIDDLLKLYQSDDIDKNVKSTGTLISNILDNNKIIEKKSNFMIKFDNFHDDDIDNQDLSQVYEKKFIYNQYIFKDDSIKTIKNKICCSIKLNNKFCSENYITPSRLYLWSEYLNNQKLEKVMIGQRWMKRNDLLNIDVEPLPINDYLNLEPSIKNLKDTLKRYVGKIRREEEDNNILFDYKDYYLNDTIYMIDIYNELGLNININQEQMQNLIETYFKIYFPRIKIEDIQGIIDMLNKVDVKTEELNIKNTFDTIYNDQIIENEITELIEKTKMDKKKEYLKLFEDGNFITQSQIHINLVIYDEQLEIENKENLNKINKLTSEYGAITLPKLDLFRIFNDFTPDDRYPFIQYQVPDGQIIFKYYEEYMNEFAKAKDNVDMITKWFENSPYGISFKMKIETKNDGDKFMGININEIGKIEYKTQWKEEDFANINDILNTYSFIKELVVKINETLINHPRKVSLKIPEDYEFRFSFINCIQKFKIPDNKIINHNDFSDFCIFFFPYVALVIEPRKRQSKIVNNESKSKYGSYLRYKRVSKFENQGRIEQRILSYLRNFDFDESVLGDEIAKQFNITLEKAKEEIVRVKSKFPNMSKVSKNPFKKSDELPRFKPPGIGIDIQGRIPEKYKIRISGARDQHQLERIITFMNILLYLYNETYIKKNPQYQIIKEKLKKLTNIAKRRNKVDEIVNYQKDVKSVKQMIQIDKKRLGYTPEEGQESWTRYCQNSGNDKKRRPLQIIGINVQKLNEKGYKLNKKTGEYEKKIIIKHNGKKDEEIILKALKVMDKEETTGAVNDIYYTCDPEDNGEHMYVGFLTRSNNPFGICMPCCFKKNPLISLKKDKQDFYKRCLGLNTDDNKSQNNLTGDILYILQDTNKIQEGRLGNLPKFIDLITNINFNKKKEIKNHYLHETDSYFYKLGINQDDYSFIKTLTIVLNMSIDDIKNHIINFLKLDKDENYYLSLNDGDIRAEYRLNDFIRFIQNENFIDYYYLKDLLKIEGLFTKRGIFTIIFNKASTIIKKGIEKEKIKEDFYLLVDKDMVIDFDYCLEMFQSKDILILIKDSKFYYPFVEVSKLDKDSKNIKIKKLFNIDTDSQIIEVIKNFFSKTINDIKIDYSKFHTSARETFIILSNISQKNENYKVTHQVIDSRFKCKYLITKNSCLIAVIPSGIVDNLPFICLNTDNKKDCFSKLKFLNIDDSTKYLEDLYKLSNKKLNIKPIGFFYDVINSNNIVNIIGIMTSNNDFIPVEPTLISKKQLDKNKILYQNRPLYHELDQKLVNYSKDKFNFIDDRIKNINRSTFLEESYQLFRFELSNILSDSNFKKYSDDLKEYIKDKNFNKIQDCLMNLCTSKIGTKILNKNNIVGTELIKIINELPDLNTYKINNQREICSKLDENKCISNAHCVYDNSSKKKSSCHFALTEDNLIQFIKKLSVEIIEQDIKAYEILREKKYYVSDIVDYNNFTEKHGQRIIKSSNTNLQKILVDIFGKEHIPKIGRRHINKKSEVDLHTLQLENPLKDIKDAYSQTLIPYNYSIIRAYVNGYYWIKHELYTIEARNLGYYSDLQNEIMNLFRSYIIDWLNIPSNIDLLLDLSENIKEIINNDILFINSKSNKKNIINNYIVRLMENNIENNLGLFELFIFNKIHKIPILLSINGVPTYIINDNIITLKNNKNIDKYSNKHNICINMDFNQNIKYPNILEIVYYK